ncbi:hypothetical protein EDB85DRAFT_2143898 [Lactarius pseudohatsudake]|nr:hypothetical protein EDB85DRAFT_2143898 [Lactarius pseudohatsudake]
MLGANVDAIPAPPPRSEPIISVDGFWGPHEWVFYPQPYRRAFPYLSWIPIRRPKSSVPFDILTRPVEKTMWRTHGHRSDSHIINADLLDEFTTKWKSIKAALEESLSAMSSRSSFSCVEQPMKAYVRAFEALKRLEEHFEAWRDFVDVFRNLQRCLLELSAFLEWWKDVRAGDAFQSSPRAPTRGAIFVFEDEHLYADHVRWSVAAYILVPKSTFALDLAKEVVLAPRKLCSAQPMSLQPLFHSLHHWYYPPLVDDVMADLETAARGYLERLDTFRPTKGFKRSLDKKENKKNDEAGRMAKKARMSAASQIPRLESVELRRLTGAGTAPEWFPKTQDVWIHAMNHVSHLELASSASPRRFSLPPIHLFWGGNDENQRIYYYHFLVLRHEIRERPRRDLPPLTTSEWRSILGNSYWKRQLPKRDSPSPDATFDPNVFWKYGGPLFFGDQRSVDIASGRYNITTSLPCRCDVQMTMVDDADIRQVVLYYLNSYHAFEEIKEMERIQFPTTFEKGWRGQEMYVYMIAEMWDSSGGNTNFKFFENKKVWRNWLWAVREVVMGWVGFDGWDWGGFSNVRTLSINALSAQDFYRLSAFLSLQEVSEKFLGLPPPLQLVAPNRCDPDPPSLVASKTATGDCDSGYAPLNIRKRLSQQTLRWSVESMDRCSTFPPPPSSSHPDHFRTPRRAVWLPRWECALLRPSFLGVLNLPHHTLRTAPFISGLDAPSGCPVGGCSLRNAHLSPGLCREPSRACLAPFMEVRRLEALGVLLRAFPSAVAAARPLSLSDLRPTAVYGGAVSMSRVGKLGVGLRRRCWANGVVTLYFAHSRAFPRLMSFATPRPRRLSLYLRCLGCDAYRPYSVPSHQQESASLASIQVENHPSPPHRQLDRKLLESCSGPPLRRCYGRDPTFRPPRPAAVAECLFGTGMPASVAITGGPSQAICASLPHFTSPSKSLLFGPGLGILKCMQLLRR